MPNLTDNEICLGFSAGILLILALFIWLDGATNARNKAKFPPLDK